MLTDRLVVVGKALKPVGLKGEIKIYPYTESLDVFKDFPFLVFGEERFEVKRVRNHQKLVAILLTGIESQEDATRLKGLLVKASARFFMPKEEDEYYWFELIGLPVFNLQGKPLGNVESIIRTSAHDILQVQTEKAELLIPMVDEIVQTIDLEKAEIVVDLLSGMAPDD
jgi:16S rRNA processing protein RimM